MKNIKLLLITLVLLGSALLAKSQTGTCGSPKTLTTGTCTSRDTFNIAAYYLKFTAHTDSVVYLFKICIEGISTYTNYSVKLYAANCSSLTAGDLSFEKMIVGDTVYCIPQHVENGSDYLIELKNNNSSPASKTYYAVCMSETYMKLGQYACPASCNTPTPGCNLVCNGDFECITTPLGYAAAGGISKITNAYSWFNANCGTGDLYSPLYTLGSTSSAPCNARGAQYGYGGSGNYAGIITFVPTPIYTTSAQYYQEFIETKLTSPMVANRAYQVSLYVSKAENSETYPNGLGIYLSNTVVLPAAACPTLAAPAITLTPTYTTGSVSTFTNATNWTQIAFNYTPTTGGEQYLIIGPSTSTCSWLGTLTTSSCNPSTTYKETYLYIDHVSVITIPYVVGPSPACPQTAINFTVNCPLSPATYTWDYGDASGTSTTSIPFGTHTYTNSASNTYTITLYTSYAGNTYTSTTTYTTITLSGSFTYTNNCSMGLTTLFTAIPTCTTTNMYYTWTFGDGGTYSSSSPNCAYTYTGSGTYTPSVTINWGPTTWVPLSQTLTIQPTPTVVINSSGGSLCAANNQTFTALPSPSGSYTYAWSASSGTIAGSSTSSTVGVNLTGIGSTALITLTLTGANTCSTITTYSVFPCCSTTGATSVFATNYNFTANKNYTSGIYIFTGSVTISPSVSVTFSGCEVKMNPNSSIYAGSSSSLIVQSSYIHACSAQWNSIYTSTNSVISFETSIVEDAQRVVVDSIGSGSLSSLNSIFNKNYKGFVFKKSTTNLTLSIKNNAFTNADLTSTLSVISTTVPVAMTGTTVNSPGTYSALPSVNLLPPYSSITAQTGIECIKTTGPSSAYLAIGHTKTSSPIGNDNQNIFHRLSEGVALYNSKVQVLNQYFQYCVALPNTSGIYIKGDKTSGNISDAKIGTATNSKCYFYNNTYGIYSTFPSALNIQSAVFNGNTTAGVKVYDNSGNKTCLISLNNFNNSILGIRMQDNYYLNATISSNTFSNSAAVGSYSTNYGAYVSETIPPSAVIYPAYTIGGNTIVGYYNGFLVNNTYTTFVQNNAINMRADATTNNYQQGVQVILCNAPTVQTNTISITGGTNTASWQQGILTSACTLPSVLCNSVTGLGTAIKIEGVNLTSSNGNGYCGNLLTSYGSGFWLDAYGEIGDQFFGAAKYASDNRWVTGASYQTKVTGSSNIFAAAGYSFYTRSTSSYSISNTSTVSVYPAACSPTACPLLGTNNTASTSVCGGGGGGGGGSLMSGGGDSLLMRSVEVKPYLMQNAAEIANGTHKYSINNENLQWISKWQLYSSINETKNITEGDASLSNFRNAMEYHNIGRFSKTNDLFRNAIISDSKNGLMEAMISNNSIKATNSLEWNQKIVNSMYVSYVASDNKLDKSQIIDLEKIAELCPMTDGLAVYQARAMLFNFTHKKYNSICENNDVDGNKSIDQNTIEGVSENGIKVYPNPSNNVVFIETGDYDNCELIMFNLLGQIVLKQSLDKKTQINVSHLQNGTYFYQITRNEAMLKRNKLIIVK